MALLKKKEKHTFASYSHADSRIVHELVNGLREEGCRVWMDTSSIVAGSSWRDSIADSILEAECIITFISNNYMSSENCRIELGYALDKKKKIICVLLEDNVKLSSGLEMYLLQHQAILMSSCVTNLEAVLRIKKALPNSVIEKRDEEPESYGRGTDGQRPESGYRAGGARTTDSRYRANGGPMSEKTTRSIRSGRQALGVRREEAPEDMPETVLEPQRRGKQRRGEQSLQEANRQRRRKEGRRKLKLVLGFIVVLAVAAGIFVAYRAIRGNTYTIKLTDYVTAPVFAGLEGEGYIAEGPALDEERLKEDIKEGLSYRKQKEDLPDPAAAAPYISLDVSPTESLSSGDTVTVTLEYNKDALEETYGFKFTGDSLEVTVQGLGEFQALDPFAGVQLTFSGTAPNAEVTVTFPEGNPTGGSNYQLTIGGEERQSGLNIGDVITLTLNEDGQAAWHEAGLTPSRTEVSYTVTDADVTRYVTGTGDFSVADRSALDAEALSLIEASTASWSYRPEIQIDRLWLMIPKPDYRGDHAPYLVYAFRTEGQDSDGNTVTKYLSVATSALWIDAKNTEGVLLAEDNTAESGEENGTAEDETDVAALAEKTDALPSKTEGAIRYSLPDFGRVNSYDDAESLESSEITARVDKYQANEMTK